MDVKKKNVQIVIFFSSYYEISRLFNVVTTSVVLCFTIAGKITPVHFRLVRPTLRQRRTLMNRIFFLALYSDL